MSETIDRAKQSRGYRNKNPGNIRINPNNKWQGLAGAEDRVNPEFVMFESHEMGIRALAVLLTTYFDRHELKTIRGIVNRWAPPVGNANGRGYTQNTKSYVDVVSNRLGARPDTEINLHDFETMNKMVRAIIEFELGGQPYDDATIFEGLRRAGFVRPISTVREAAKTSTGIGAIQVGAIAAAATAAAPVITSLGALNPTVGVAVVLAAVGFAVFYVLRNRTDA